MTRSQVQPSVDHDPEERELLASERAAAAIERLRVLLNDRRTCGGWAELTHD